MAVMKWQKTQMRKLLLKLEEEYPHIQFKEGDYFYWSPKKTTITYSFATEHDKQEVTLLHELAHAVLDHASFTTDFELLLLEVAAWDKAQDLSKAYNIDIPDEHVQKCLDTYRDWLHMRSTCPGCTSNGIQSKQTKKYTCPNCNSTWEVSSSRLCRPYRKVAKQKTL